MAIQILDEPGMAQRLGSSFGTGLSKGLDLLIKEKMQGMQAKRLEASGLPSVLAYLDPQVQAAYLREYGSQRPISEALRQKYSQFLGQQEKTSPTQEEIAERPDISQLNLKELKELADIKEREQRMTLQQQKAESIQSKETREFSRPYIEGAERAKANIRDYDVLEKLAEKGNIRSGNTSVILDKLGLSGFNRNFDTQIAEKTMARLAQNISGVFGTNSRITNFLEQTFQRSLPTLWNTKEGVMTISRIGKLVEQGKLLKDQARREVLKQSGGKLAYDTEDKINDLIAPQLAQIEEKIISLATNSINPQQHKVSQVFDKMPDARKFKRMRHNGVIYQSIGGKWVKE